MIKPVSREWDVRPQKHRDIAKILFSHFTDLDQGFFSQLGEALGLWRALLKPSSGNYHTSRLNRLAAPDDSTSYCRICQVLAPINCSMQDMLLIETNYILNFSKQ